MPHDLLIAATILRPDHSGGYLQPFEMVRGQESNLSVTVKNLGGDEFPGGTINEILLRYGASGDSRTSYAVELEIGRLIPHEETSLTPTLDVIPIIEGETWLTLSVNATDGENIKCFQSTADPPVGISKWIGAFFTINRERYRIIQLLTELLETNSG